VLQLNAQAVPLHVAVPFDGAVHAVHEFPHVLTDVLSAQAFPQAWNPLLQVNPHDVPLHVAVPLVGAVHAVHEPPHVFVDEFDTQAPLQL
jgi:hypothetical protein